MRVALGGLIALLVAPSMAGIGYVLVDLPSMRVTNSEVFWPSNAVPIIAIVTPSNTVTEISTIGASPPTGLQCTDGGVGNAYATPSFIEVFGYRTNNVGTKVYSETSASIEYTGDGSETHASWAAPSGGAIGYRFYADSVSGIPSSNYVELTGTSFVLDQGFPMIGGFSTGPIEPVSLVTTQQVSRVTIFGATTARTNFTGTVSGGTLVIENGLIRGAY